MSIDLDLLLDTENSPLEQWRQKVHPHLAALADSGDPRLIQHGIRAGSHLVEHLVQGVASLPDWAAMGGLTGEEVRLLLAAFTLHDPNKLPGERRSLPTIVRDAASLRQYRKALGVDDLLGGPDVFEAELRYLIENTSDEHAKDGDAFLGRLSRLPFDVARLRDRLMPLMVAADIRDLSWSLDEQHFKDRVARKLAEVTGDRITIVRHRVAEHRGVLSQLIHKAAEDVLRSRGAVPTWIYVSGTAYLARGPLGPIEVDEVLERVGEARASLLMTDPTALLKPGKDGLKIDRVALALNRPEAVGVLVQEWAIGSNLVGLRKTLEDRRRQFNDRRGVDGAEPVLASGVRWEHESDRWIQAGRVFRAAENILKDARKTFKKETKGWDDPTAMLLAQVTGAAAELARYEGLDPLYERPFVIGGNLPGGLEEATRLVGFAAGRYRELLGDDERGGLRPELKDYVREVLHLDVADAPAFPAQAYLQRYLANDRSSVGASRHGADKLLSANVGRNVKVSQFSNSLGAGRTDPTRLVDPVSQEALALEQLIYGTGASVPLFLHATARAGSSVRQWSAASRALLAARGEDVADRLFLANPDAPRGERWALKKVGLVLPQREVELGNVLTLPFYSPADSDTERYFQAAITAVVLAHELPVCVVVNDVPQLVVPPQDVSAAEPGESTARLRETLRFESRPSTLTPLLPKSSWTIAELPELVRRVQRFCWLEFRLRDKISRAQIIGLAGAMASGFLSAVAWFDRRLERAGATGGPLVAEGYDALHSLMEDRMTDNDKKLMAAIEGLAQTAFDHRLTPSGFDRNKLLRPLNECLKLLRRAQPPLDIDALLAAAEDRVFTAIETVKKRDSGHGAGRHEAEGAQKFASQLRAIIADFYGDDLARFRSQERILRSSYITAFRRLIRAAAEAKKAANTPES